MATFIYPTVTRVTSGFRPAHRKNHNGVDFAKAGYHVIKATAAGVVTRSYVSSSYGECIMIEHNINGQTWESVYAHMRKGSRKVHVGERVKQGQAIGVMGNTGRSSGQHLHFELHKGKWNMNKSNAVDPLKYLGNATSHDNYIKTLQRAIGTTADGIAGKNTWKALTKKLQTELNKQFNAKLAVDGIFGTKTQNACVTVSHGAKGEITWVLQAALYFKGYDEVGKADGIFGDKTLQAVKNFQKENKLTVDGKAGKKTFAKLFR